MKRKLALSLFVLISSLIAALAWLTMTQSGLRWTYQYARSYLPQELTISALEGSLIGPITVKAIQYKKDGMEVRAGQVTLDWAPAALLSTHIDIKRLHVQSLNVSMAPSEKPGQTTKLPEIYLPWRVTLRAADIDEIIINRGNQHLALQRLTVAANTQLSQLAIEKLGLEGNNFNLNLKGNIQLTQSYPHDLLVDWKISLPNKKLIKASGYLKGDINTTNIQQTLSSPVQAGLNATVHNVLGQPAWNAEAHATDINPGILWPKWPGKLTTRLTSSGQFANGELVAHAEISQVTGKLRDYPVSAHGSLTYQNNGLDIHVLDAHSGSSKLSAKGHIADTIKLDWSINAPDAAELYPGSHGHLQASGSITGPRNTPRIQASINGKNLGLAEYEIGFVNGNIGMDLYTWQQVAIRLNSQALNIKGYPLQSLDINANSNHAKVKLIHEMATANIELERDTDSQGWRGQITRADVQSSRFANWQLDKPARFNIDNMNVSIENVCWHSQQAELCAGLKRDSDTWLSRVEASKIPLSFLGTFLPTDLKPGGIVNAKAELKLSLPDQILGQLHIELPPGTLNYALLEEEHSHMEYRGGTVNVILDQQGLNASAKIDINSDNRIQGQLTLPNINPFALDRANQPLQATAQINIHDLGLIEAIIPEVENLQGELAINLSSSGTLAQPVLTGNAWLRDGALDIPRLGLNIQKLNLDSQTEEFKQLKFRLSARSGKGNVEIDGQSQLDINAGWPTSLSIKGESFEVSHIPEAQVLVSPNLQIAIQKRTIHINGDVHIPFAKLQPKDTTTATRVSSDQVIIGGEQPVEEKWSIFTRVRLSLGERVNFFGFGFDGRLDGNLLLEDEPDKVTRATGVINVPEGRYRAYGQRLDVDYGKLSYTGGPLTNPGLDLRAVRHVEDVTAGLRLRGTFSQPNIELFSIPAMGQTNILAYLMLGRPIESASGDDGAMMARAALALGLSGGDQIARTLGYQFGIDEMRVESSNTGEQASMVIGRYLSPKLYISYGIGLIEAVNTFTARYQISKKWQLKGESGEHQSADLIYSIER